MRGIAVRPRTGGLRRAVPLLLSVLLLAPVRPLGGGGASAAPDGTVEILVRDARTGELIPNFQWMVNLDNSHEHASVTPPASYSPVVATGEVSDGSGAVEVSLPDTVDPDRGYLVTAFVNDGVGEKYPTDYKIGGAHFRMPDDDGQVVVELQPNPLPLATLRVQVFHDNRPVNGEQDIGFEDGLEGFRITLADRIGQVVTDWFGNPICTQYEDLNGNGRFDVPGDLDPEGSPVPVPQTGGLCETGPDGVATVPNLGPDKYEVEAIPPDGSGWIQTATIEGTLANDAWVQEGATGFAPEPEAGLFAQVWFGFVRRCSFGDPTDDCLSSQADRVGRNGVIRGRVRSIVLDNEMKPLLMGNPVVRPFIALTNIGGNDEQVWTGRGEADGTFEIADVPAGLYQMAIWDLPIDHIIQFLTVRVRRDDCGSDIAPCTVDLGDIGVPPWFGRVRGSVYLDQNENGVRDPGEVSLPNQDLDTRFKDGTIYQATFADRNGNYEFPEVFEWEHFIISEVGYGRFKQTGAAAYRTDPSGNPVGYPEGFINQDLGLASLLQGTITWAGTTNYIDWGKKPYGRGENGGIVGIVFYDLTRNELDARLEAPEDYEPGVPNVPVSLYAPALDQNGDPVYDPDTGEIVKDHLAAVYKGGLGTDSWYDDSLPANCLPTPSLGRTADQVEPNGDPPGEPSIFRDCIELPSLLDQVRPGVFDGGYAFDADCFDPDGPAATDPDGDEDGDGTPNRFDPDLLLDYDAGECDPIPSGQWVVKIDPPPGYRVVKEEDVNVFGGDQFVPAVPPPPCVGPLHTVHVVDDPAEASFDPADPSHTSGVYNPDFLATTSPLAPEGGSPYEGQRKPLCDQRLIDLKDGFNANSDFFIFTDVPQPGRIVGVLLDDLTIELDPSSPLYGEKRGIPHAPVGIRDFTGRLITTVYSDENGYWEVLLPSTGSYNCPLPAGPCPGMYYVVGNDPGDARRPDPRYNPNYQTLPLVFEVWPGTTTYADVATIPITGFVQNPGTQFATPPRCDLPAGTPDLREVSRPYGAPGDSFVIEGTGFGDSGTATLGGTELTVDSWSDTRIEVTVPGEVAPGAYQLAVTGASGARSPVGITFHVLGGGYDPPAVHVDGSTGDDQAGDGSATAPYRTVQRALDAAGDGSLVLVHPGVYNGKFILHSNVKLQGYGTGATILNGLLQGSAEGFLTHAQFDAKVASIPHDGPPVPWGQTVTVLATDGQFHAGFNPQIDGFTITGGRADRADGASAGEGGGVLATGFARYLEVSNNLVQSNSGMAGGGIIVGLPTAQLRGLPDNQNDHVRIHHNRVLNNGGVVLAGGIALFNGAEGYEVDHNIVCGNYSAEYGAGISHWGLSPGGRIHDNQVLFNYAFDEGGGIMVAGEPSRDPNGVSRGSGSVTIERNLVQGNVSNDDGGGIRLLNPVQWTVRIVNNLIVNNLATDTGGGIALDDALSVEIVGNTVARNTSTGTAEDADRTSCPERFGGSIPPFATCPHGAGLVSEGHSQALLDAIRAGAFDCSVVNCTSDFSDPALFDDIFWRNEAFYLDGSADLFDGGLTPAGDIDFDVLAPGAGRFHATFSDCTAPSDHCPAASSDHNLFVDPSFVDPVTADFVALAFAGDPSFVTVIIRSGPEDPPGDYHLQAPSPVMDAGTDAVGAVAAPADDVDGDARPQGEGIDLGADEVRVEPIHLGDLEPSSVILDALTWRARAVLTVHHRDHRPASGVTVTGEWSAPGDTDGRTLSCTTGPDGTCAVQTGRLSKATDPASTYTVTSLTHPASSYRAGDNHDPDGDSDGTSVTAPRPTLHVGNLDGTGVHTTATAWRARVTVGVHDPTHAPVAGATVAGTWTAAGQPAGSGACTTTARGTCRVRSRQLALSTTEVTFTVTSVTQGSLAYEPGSNHDPDGDGDGSTVEVARPAWLLGFARGGSVGGLAVRDEDVVRVDDGDASLFFDGSDVGLGPVNVDAFALLGPATLLLSFDRPVTLPGPGRVDDSDVVRFDATSLGEATDGTFSMYLDGSDVGLATDGEDVDSVQVRKGRVLVSTVGPAAVPGLRAGGEDLLELRPASLGARTRGSWSVWFDGSDVGLTGREENVDAAWVGPSGRVFLSTRGAFSVPGLSGGGEDVLVCRPSSLGPATRCAFSLAVDGSAEGLAGLDVDGIRG